MSFTPEIEKQRGKWKQDLLALKEPIKTKTITNESSLEIADLLFKHFTQNGLQPDTAILNAHLQLCETLEQSSRVIEHYRLYGVWYNTATINLLISKASDFNTSIRFLNKIRELRLKPTKYTFYRLFGKAETLEDGYNLMDKMNENGIVPDLITYNNLLGLCSDSTQRNKVFGAMTEDGINPNNITYNTIISHSAGFPEALDTYFQFIERLPPDFKTLISLLKKAETIADLNRVERLFSDSGLIPDGTWITALKRIREKFKE